MFSFTGPMINQPYNRDVNVGTPTVGTALEFRSRVINTGGTVYSDIEEVTVEAPTSQGVDNLFFLHHSVGQGLIDGGMRDTIAAYNSSHGTSLAFWDHGYNGDGLTDPEGNPTYTSYSVPGDNTDPDGLHALWTSSDTDWVACRNAVLASHELIAFKSCYPASAIPDPATLQQYRDYYLAMRDFFDTQRDRLFVVVSTPPLHRLATNTAEANNARAFANWLKSSTYLSGHPNVLCFDLFDHLAKADDGSPTANMLRYAYELSHSSDNSHPNTLANETVGPAFAQFLCDAATSFTPSS
jgi:hypothetical protein